MRPRRGHPDFPVGIIERCVRGRVSDRVLTPDFFCDPFADRRHFAELSGQKGFAARGARDFSEDSRVLIRIEFVEESDGKHGNVGALELCRNQRKIVTADFIPAIADHDESLSFPARLSEVSQPKVDCVVKRRHAVQGPSRVSQRRR